MKHLVVVVACLILSTAAFASSSSLSPLFIGEIMRGNTAIGNPSQSVAWSANPAALAGEKTDAVTDGPAMDNAASFATNISGDYDQWGLSYGGRSMVKGWGIGAGYTDTDYAKGYGLGFGMPLSGFEVGVNWRRLDWDSMASVDSLQAFGRDSSQDVFDLAGRKVWTYGDDNASSVKGMSKLAAGVVLRDVTDEIDTVIDLGVSADFANGWTFNIDLLDFDTVNLGASTRLGVAKQWEVGAGLADGDLTLGAIYDIAKDGEPTAWRVGLAWADYDWDDVLVAGVSYNW